jgi:hypothetical protein
LEFTQKLGDTVVDVLRTVVGVTPKDAEGKGVERFTLLL